MKSTPCCMWGFTSQSIDQQRFTKVSDHFRFTWKGGFTLTYRIAMLGLYRTTYSQGCAVGLLCFFKVFVTLSYHASWNKINNSNVILIILSTRQEVNPRGRQAAGVLYPLLRLVSLDFTLGAQIPWFSTKCASPSHFKSFQVYRERTKPFSSVIVIFIPEMVQENLV